MPVLELTNKEDWLKLNNRGVKSDWGQAADRTPAPVAQPQMGGAVGADEEPGRPNIPILPKPPTKVRLKYVLFMFIQVKLKRIKSFCQD